MASTDQTGLLLPIVGTSLGNGLHLAAGRATLAASGSGGTVDVETGLRSVLFFVATQIGTCVATEGVVLQAAEDLPLASGTVTVNGFAVDIGGATVIGDGESFSWIAIGYR